MQQQASKTVDHFFRHEYGRIVSFLTKRVGADYFDEVEDAVQDALIKAMQVWPFKGTPDNPSGWVLMVAKNKLYDKLRRESNFNNKSQILADEKKKQAEELSEITLDSELSDDFLKMMFACCHPTLSAESQIILVLKILAGFGKKEIAKALLKSEDAVAKAYTRAKSKFKQFNDQLEVPVGKELEKRLDIITKIIYLIYNEGYNSTSEDQLIRKDLCFEAMRLNKLLLDNQMLRHPNLYALMALMCFQSSRFESRIGEDGRLLTLDEQDRSTWNKELIKEGSRQLALASSGNAISEYHIQASIAACHSFAPSFAETDWKKILVLYDALLKIKRDVITQLNRVVALAKVKGAEEAILELKALPEEKLKNNYLFYAIEASLYNQTGQKKLAIDCYNKALTLTFNKTEQKYLKNKLEAISS